MDLHEQPLSLNAQGNAAAITNYCGTYHNWGISPHIHRHTPLLVSGPLFGGIDVEQKKTEVAHDFKEK